ncbi:MAG: hypothetical protein Q4D98_10775 [Planctomycetia bacterium]|nr:hypothetical protein [Planctomycetia bacterium]
MEELRKLEQKIFEGYQVGQGDVRFLMEADLEHLKQAACEIRRHYSGRELLFCGSIVCPYGREIDVEEIRKEGLQLVSHGARRADLDMRHNPLDQRQVDALCEACRWLTRNTGLDTSLSHARLTQEQFCQLRQAGLKRYHEFIGVCRSRFDKLASRFLRLSYDEKIEVLKSAKRAGLEITSGGFVDVGETTEECNELVLESRDMGIAGLLIRSPEWIWNVPSSRLREWNPSVPLEDFMRRMAIARFIMPKVVLVVDWGVRAKLPEYTRRLLESGANGIMTGLDAEAFGVTYEDDLDIVREMGFVIA